MPKAKAWKIFDQTLSAGSAGTIEGSVVDLGDTYNLAYGSVVLLFPTTTSATFNILCSIDGEVWFKYGGWSPGQNVQNSGFGSNTLVARYLKAQVVHASTFSSYTLKAWVGLVNLPDDRPPVPEGPASYTGTFSFDNGTFTLTPEPPV